MDRDITAYKLIIDLSCEVEQLAKIRHAKSGKALLNLILEMNDKWNALIRMLEKKYGESPLLPNGFKNYWFDKMPELKLIEKGLMR